MPTFSERNGLSQDIDIQFDSISEYLRNSLWNLILEISNLFDNEDRIIRNIQIMPRGSYGGGSAGPGARPYNDPQKSLYYIAKLYAINILRIPYDEIPLERGGVSKYLKNKFLKECSWHVVYSMVEILVQHSESVVPNISLSSKTLADMANRVLEQEKSAYRFINNLLTPIYEKHEIEEIEEAVNVTGDALMPGVKLHLNTSLQMLGKKPEPDYRNSIKESISAVESACNVISGNDRADLNAALNRIGETHPALKSAFQKLYAWTCDEKGIRHATVFLEENVGFPEAKFMLVACSAFVNYLKQKMDKKTE